MNSQKQNGVYFDLQQVCELLGAGKLIWGNVELDGQRNSLKVIVRNRKNVHGQTVLHGNDVRRGKAANEWNNDRIFPESK